MRPLFYILILIGLIPANIYGQNPISIHIEINEGNSLPINFATNKTFRTNYEIQIAARSYINSLHEEGFLSASVDSITGDSISQTLYFFIGQKFELVTLNTDSVDEEILSRTGFRDKQFRNKPFNPKQISQFFNDALTYLENNGFPFAEIKLDNIQMNANSIEASVILHKNQFYKIDSIAILGENTRLNRHYIENITGLKTNYPYDERVIKNIGKRIAENPFISELKQYEVVFTEKSCKVVLILKPKKANLFDGIIGFQPQKNNTKMILTGDVKISLGNIVSQGERLNLRWQRLQNETQEINASLDIPFLFRTPIGIGYSLDIYRRDTTFNNVTHQFSIPFRLLNGSQFKGYFTQFKTSLIATSLYENKPDIPPYNDAEKLSYGVGYTAYFVANKFNPYKGWILDIKGGAGTNKIIQNSALELVNYDSINLETSLIEGSINLKFFQPIGRNSTLMFQTNSAFKQSSNLVDNQLYRIGGLYTIRGFDQQSIFASAYSIATLEYRLLFGETSRIILFYDVAWYEQNSISNFKTDIPYGFGTGISFGTGVGQFSLNYALGSEQGNPIIIKTGKIHFGFINFF